MRRQSKALSACATADRAGSVSRRRCRKHAKYVLPASSFAEKEGTFVNHANLAQSIRRAIHAPGLHKTDGQIFMDLMQRRGLMHAGTVRKEMAAEIPFFAPLVNELGQQGMVLGAS